MCLGPKLGSPDQGVGTGVSRGICKEYMFEVRSETRPVFLCFYLETYNR